MSELTIEQVRTLADAVGLELDDERARTIASRLSGILDELEQIPDELLASVEPAHRFDTEQE